MSAAYKHIFSFTQKEEAPEGAPVVLLILLAEVALQEAFKSLAVAGLVASH